MNTNIKKSLLIFFFSTLFLACGSIKPPAGQENYDIPCIELQSDKKFFRAFGQGSSNSPAGAIQSAKGMAASDLALTIQSTIKVVSERYSSNIENGMKGEFTAITEELGRRVATTNVSKVTTACSQTTRDRSSGSFLHYITLEVSVDDVINDFADLAEQTKQNIRVNRDAFRAIFNEEMNKN